MSYLHAEHCNQYECTEPTKHPCGEYQLVTSTALYDESFDLGDILIETEHYIFQKRPNFSIQLAVGGKSEEIKLYDKQYCLGKLFGYIYTHNLYLLIEFTVDGLFLYTMKVLSGIEPKDVAEAFFNGELENDLRRLKCELF